LEVVNVRAPPVARLGDSEEDGGVLPRNVRRSRRCVEIAWPGSVRPGPGAAGRPGPPIG